jgi:Protein of unknown function (DUF1501)
MPVNTLNRRAFLQLGGSAYLGTTLPQLGRLAQGAPKPGNQSVILVLLTGGCSQLDSFDPKPDAPAEIRGEFGTIATKLPGVRLSEHLPLLAGRMQHWALVRSMSHEHNGHLPATHRILTGSPMPLERGSDLDNILSRRDFPCYGAGLAAARPRHDGVPSGVTLPHALIEGPLTWPGQHGGFLGPRHDPLLVTQDPNSPAFRMDTLALAEGTSAERLGGRKNLLEALDSAANPAKVHQDAALRMLTSDRVANAFRIQNEPERNRDRYGRTAFGQTLLLARRLVQAGVPMIQANMGIVQSWDTHVDNWGRMKNRLLPELDRALAGLMDDLVAEGLIDNTLVVVTGEFGRTPKVSTLPGEKIPGRDHWAAVYSALFAGAGVKGGQVIGKSDSKAAYPVTPSFMPYDVGATVYHALGLAPDTEVADSQNRPIFLNRGQVMNPLYSLA